MCTIHLKPNNFHKANSILTKYLKKDQTLFIITDQNVSKLYLSFLIENLKLTFYNVHYYVINVGEQSKSFRSLQNLIDWLIKNNAQRDSAIINLGGGVVSDLGGFLASIYMRGINYINIPTTILAQVDAAVGGKTAINFSDIKNIVGSFYNPLTVIVDPYLLNTLSNQEVMSGWGEILKYSLLTGRFKIPVKSFSTDSPEFLRILQACIEYKQEVVEKDLHDKGLRQLLNLGHTAGHGLEVYFKLPHGIAIAIGILIATELSFKLSICNEEYREFVYNSYRYLYSKVKLTKQKSFNLNQLFNIIRNDKKRASSGDLNWILPISFGRASVQSVNDSIWKEVVADIVLELIDEGEVE